MTRPGFVVNIACDWLSQGDPLCASRTG